MHRRDTTKISGRCITLRQGQVAWEAEQTLRSGSLMMPFLKSNQPQVNRLGRESWQLGSALRLNVWAVKKLKVAKRKKGASRSEASATHIYHFQMRVVQEQGRVGPIMSKEITVMFFRTQSSLQDSFVKARVSTGVNVSRRVSSRAWRLEGHC